MSAEIVENEVDNFYIEDQSFINKLLVEMKSEFNKSDLEISHTVTVTEEMVNECESENSSSTKSSHVESDEYSNSKFEKSDESTKSAELNLPDIEESVLVKSEDSLGLDSCDEKSITLFKKPNSENSSPGRRSLRNKSNSIDDKSELRTLKRSTRRRSKDFAESVLQSAIARKEKSYNESNKPQRLTRQLKPTQKILENIAYAKQDKTKPDKSKSIKGKICDNDNSDLHINGESSESGLLHKSIKHAKGLKRFKSSISQESYKKTDSDQSDLFDSKPRSARRSRRIPSNRLKEEDLDSNEKGQEPVVGDKVVDFSTDPESLSVGAQLIASRLCLCTQRTQYYVASDEVVYCNAVDSVCDRLVGCTRVVNEKEQSMLRPSKRVPYLILCDLHRNRIIRHNCCPTCGVFCTQGRFVECQARHQYHRDCQISVGEVNCCPHCGLSTPDSDVYITMHSSKKPVFLPTQKNQYPSAKMSFNASTSNNIETPKCSTPLLLPTEVFQTLNSPSVDNQRFDVSELIEAIKDSDVEKLTVILGVKNIDLNFKISDYNEGTVLHFAAQYSTVSIVHMLVVSGVELNIFDKEQNTPLMLAIIADKNEMVQYLIKAGANITLKGTDGMSALHLAAKCGNLNACDLLLNAGALTMNFVNSQDDGGWTPLVWACEHGYAEVAEYLISKGGDPSLRDVEHNVALHWAAFSGSSQIASLLLNKGCDVNAINAHGDTPLHIGAREDMYNCNVVLLARGANVAIINKNNETPLDCVPGGGESYNVISLNVHLQALTASSNEVNKIVLSNDISNGRELNPIQCLNTLDDEPQPLDFVYVTKSCLAIEGINIDKRVTTKQSCGCEERCVTNECGCYKLSVRCWYDEEGKLIPDFNFTDAPIIFECSETCFCNAITCPNRVVQKGLTQRFQLYKTELKGWGVSTLRPVPKGTFVCEYVGEIITDAEADQRDDDTFVFDLDNREEGFCIDAKNYGNFARFINHSCHPNLMPVKVFVDHHDLRFPRVAFFACRDIKADEELSFDYGEKFWLVKYKSFSCCCESDQCMYSTEKIQQKLKDLQMFQCKA